MQNTFLLQEVVALRLEALGILDEFQSYLRSDETGGAVERNGGRNAK